MKELVVYQAPERGGKVRPQPERAVVAVSKRAKLEHILRISHLVQIARLIPERRIARILKETSDHTQVRLGTSVKHMVCKACKGVLLPSRTCRLRVVKGVCVLRCKCGHDNRMPRYVSY